MENQEGKDLTQGNLFTNMVKFCIPLLMANLLNSMYNIVDGLWVGNLIGDEGVATVTNCWPIILVVDAFLSAISVTASVMVSQRFASTEKESIKKIITPMYLLAILGGMIVSGILMFTIEVLLRILNTPEEILLASKQYSIIYLIGYLFNFLAGTIIAAIRATGNSKVPLILLTLTNIVNIVLDPIFILLGLGIAGAAIASATAMLFELIITLIYINKKTDLLKIRRKFMKFEKDFIKEAFQIGFPMIFAELSTVFTIVIEVYTSNSLGIVGSCAYGIVSKLQSVFYILGSSVKTLMTVVIGQFIGKKAFDQLGRVMKNGVKVIITPTLLIAIFLIFCSRWYCSLFSKSEEVIETAIYFLSVVGIAFVLIPLCQMMLGFVLRNWKYEIFFCYFIKCKCGTNYSFI